MVTIAIAVGCGMGAAARQLGVWAREQKRAAVAAGLAAIALVPAAQLAGNWATHDASDRYFARDYAANALETLPPRAIYFTVGDNDTFPLWYLQAAEGVRSDVRVVNLSLANTSWYVEQLVRRDPSFPLTLPNGAARQAVRVEEWRDTMVMVPVRRTAEQLGLSIGTIVPDSITMRPRPRIGDYFLPADAVLLDIIRTNAWQDSICFATTAGEGGLGWLEPYGRLQGLHWCLVPVPGAGVNQEVLRANLLERHAYRGYADPGTEIDPVSRMIGALYLQALTALLEAEQTSGATDRCREYARQLFAAVPPERLGLSVNDREDIEAHCRA
jgi:hypothetical protein